MSSNVLVRDPETTPLDCDLYKVLQQGRQLASVARHEYIFTRRVQAELDKETRDFSNLLEQICREAMLRNYRYRKNHEQDILESLWKEIFDETQNVEASAFRFCDIVIFAIQACPEAEDNVFK